MSRVPYTLKKPISVGEQGELITVLNFRSEVVAGDLRGIRVQDLNNPPVEHVLTIAGRLSGQPDVVMNKLSIADMNEVLEIVTGFFQAGQQTGTGPSQS